jgi:serine protease Do
MRANTRQFLRENLLGLSLTLIGVACLVLTASMYMANRAFPQFAFANNSKLEGADIEALEQQNKGYERIAQAVTPAIVNIQSTQVMKVQQSPFFTDPFFRQLFGDMFPQSRVPKRALGSGVIVSPDGYIITNNHVIKNASDIQVMLSDKRSFKGKVVGADPQTDVAIVKVDAKDLPTVPFGDSSHLRVGDVVMAFGNPFGLNFTVTRGIVSATGRSGLGIETYEDFIQTDAAINPGNSGGALVNVRGQVIGINTAILSTSGGGAGGEGGSNGIGLAIPANVVKHVMDDIINKGKVTRGYLGVAPQGLTTELARQFKSPDTSGALLGQVEPDSPADKAGLKQGDVIRKINGQTIEGADNLRSMIAGTNPGTAITLGVLRDGKPMDVKVTLGEQPASMAGASGHPGKASEGALRGITVQNLTPDVREQLGLQPNIRGVVISELDPSSPAAQAGLQPGDLIESVNRHAVNTVADFDRLAAGAKGEVLLRVNRGGISQFVGISPGSDSGGDDNQ